MHVTPQINNKKITLFKNKQKANHFHISKGDKRGPQENK